MFEENGFEVVLVNTDGLWYGLLTHKATGLKYETDGYHDRDICKTVASILTELE